MKKLMIIFMAVILIMGLAACKAEPQASAETTQTQAKDPKEQAESCIDKPVEDLYALIGEPTDKAYADSCLKPGVGEDGELHYDGFTVYTYKEGDVETVIDVE